MIDSGRQTGRARGTLADDLLMFVACVVALLAARRPFPDPDLGWHLAGGLWMLDTGSVPQQDPFGTTGALWICYSWLPELMYAAAFRIGEFTGVHLLEMLTFVGVAAFVVVYVRQLSRDGVVQMSRVARASEWLTTGIVLAFLLPTCTLRPHVISWVLLGVLIVLTRAPRPSVAALLSMTLLWVNSHVYWILVPFLVGLTTVICPRNTVLSRWQGMLLSVGTAVLGLANPYGWRLFEGVWSYSADQAVTKELVFELAPLTVWHEVFPLFAGTLIGAALCGRRLIEREGLATVILFLMLAAAGAGALKSLPLFAIAAAPVLVRVVLPELLGYIASLHARDWKAPGMGVGNQWVLRSLMAVVLAAICVRELAVTPFLRSPHRELLSIAGALERDQRFRDRSRVHVLSDTNYGGWLELALWLAKPADARGSRFRVAMDNRGLVMGEQRFAEYDRLRQMHGDWRATIDRWGIDVAILPTQAVIVGALVQPASTAGLSPWDLLSTSPIWTVIARPDAAQRPPAPSVQGPRATAS